MHAWDDACKGQGEHDAWMQPRAGAAAAFTDPSRTAELTTRDQSHACSYYMCLGSCTMCATVVRCDDQNNPCMHLQHCFDTF
jgi:hypothetical protein